MLPAWGPWMVRAARCSPWALSPAGRTALSDGFKVGTRSSKANPACPLARLPLPAPVHRGAHGTHAAAAAKAPPPPHRSSTSAAIEDAVESASSTKAYNFKRTQRWNRGPFVQSPPSPTAEEAVRNIFYNTPPGETAPRRRYILNCLVQDEPGVLSRVAGILAGRGFNIDSLVVSRTEIPTLSRATIVLKGERSVIEQARRQLEDLVPVWSVLDYTNIKLVERELLLVKVSTISPEDCADHVQAVEAGGEDHHDVGQPPSLDTSQMLLESHQRLHHLTELTRLFSGCIVDVANGSVIIELSAKTERVDAFLRLIKPFGIIESARSGMMAMARTVAFAEEKEDVEGDTCAVEATQLPPG